MNCFSVPCLCLRIPLHLWGLMSRISEMVVLHLPCRRGASPRPLGEVILPEANGWFDPEEGLVLTASQGEGLGCTTDLVWRRSQQRECCLSDW
jgi:hypothetical protein